MQHLCSPHLTTKLSSTVVPSAFMITAPDTSSQSLCSNESVSFGKSLSRYEVQIIQLDEVPPPAKRPLEDMYWSSEDSSDTESQDDEPVRSECCSSEENPEPSFALNWERRRSDSYPLRAKRVLSWRENFFAALDPLSDSSTFPFDHHLRNATN